SPLGYVRLHGRNYENWFRQDAAPHDRYDYLYSPEELEPWVERIKKISRDAQETYVVTNNHFRGQGVVNALEIMAMLEGEKVDGPASLVEPCPRFKESIIPPGQRVFFETCGGGPRGPPLLPSPPFNRREGPPGGRPYKPLLLLLFRRLRNVHQIKLILLVAI